MAMYVKGGTKGNIIHIYVHVFVQNACLQNTAAYAKMVIKREGENVGKTSNEVKNRYNKKTYDQIRMVLRKDSGQLVTYRAAAESAGQSLTAYIVQAIVERMQRDGFQPPVVEAEEDTAEEGAEKND